MKSTLEYIEGSASEIVSAGTFVNGQKIDAVGISVLAKYGIIQVVGKAEKVEKKRGKVGNIFRIPNEIIKVIV